MTAAEIKSKIDALKSTTPLKDQTVEVVMNTKKYFIFKIEEGAGELTFQVTRKDYYEMHFAEFLDCIEKHASAKCLFLNQDAKGDARPVTGIYLSPNYLEINTDVVEAPKPKPPATPQADETPAANS